jgi:hypothetical protein
MISFSLDGQIYELIAIEVISDDDFPLLEEFVFRSHCADCGEEFLWRSPSGTGPHAGGAPLIGWPKSAS